MSEHWLEEQKKKEKAAQGRRIVWAPGSTDNEFFYCLNLRLQAVVSKPTH
jgi:hypothetical protein